MPGLKFTGRPCGVSVIIGFVRILLLLLLLLSILVGPIVDALPYARNQLLNASEFVCVCALPICGKPMAIITTAATTPTPTITVLLIVPLTLSLLHIQH